MSATIGRPSTVLAIKQAAALGTPAKPKDGCKDCVKTGLAILPMVPTVAPVSLRGTTAALRWLDARYKAEDLSESWFILRSLPTGYLYVFKESDKQWEAYVVDRAGLLRMTPTGLMPASAAESPLMSEACKRAGDNLPAQVIAVDPNKHPRIWMAYSRYRWSPQVLTDYAANTDQRRTARMTFVDVVAAANNELGGTSKVSHGAVMSTKVGEVMADYADLATRNALNAQLITPLQDREACAGALSAKMAIISKDTPGKTGCMIMLRDPVGNAIELGATRDGFAYKVAECTGIFDVDGKRARARVVAEMVEAVRANAEKNPGPWYDRNYGPGRFMKHVNSATFKGALDDSANFKANLKKVDACSADYVAVKESNAWKAVQRWDFDAGDDSSALDHSQMVADSVRGSGVTKLEKDRVWFPVLVDMQAADANNWFYRAMAALHPDLQAYFDANKQWDKEYEDVPKAMVSLVRDISSESAQEIARIHAVIRLKRAANGATADLMEGVTSILLHLREKDPKAFNKLIRRMTVALITRADLLAQPVVVKGRYNQIVQMIQSVASGDARLAGSAPVIVRPGTVDKSYMAQKGNLGGKGMALSQGVDGAVLLDLPNDKNEVKVIGAWVVGKLQSGGTLSAADLRKLQLQNIDLTVPSTLPAQNVWLKNMLERRANQSNALLSGFAFFLQVVALSNASKDLVNKKGGMDKAEAGIGATTAILSAIAAGMEVYTAVVALRGGEAVMKTAMRTKLIAKFAGWANLIEGAWLVFKGVRKLGSDQDSGWWTVSSGVFLIAGGLATIATGSAVAGAIVAGGSAFTVPVIGWIVGTIILLGVSIYCLINAFSTDDGNLLPLEYWLDNGTFGKGAFRDKEANPFYDKAGKTAALPFNSLIDEVREFQRIVFAAAGQITGTADRHGVALLNAYEVALPRWVATSKLEMLFEGTTDGTTLRRIAFVRYLNGADQPETLSLEKNVFGMNEGPKAEVDKVIGCMRVKGFLSTMQPGGISSGVDKFFEWVGATDKKDARMYIKDVRLTVTYWPDREGMPDLTQTLSDWSVRSGS